MKCDFRFWAGVCIIALCCVVTASCISPERIPQGEEVTTLTTSVVSPPEETTPEETTFEETTPEETTPEVTESDFTNTPDPDGTKRY